MMKTFAYSYTNILLMEIVEEKCMIPHCVLIFSSTLQNKI